MENDTAVIKEQMEQTRTALTEKVEAIEERVANAVKDTTEAVSHTVHAVTQTVEDTVHSVSDSVQSVKAAMSDSVQSVKDAMDVNSYVEKYPWVSMGASVALGYGLGCLLGQLEEKRPGQTWAAAAAPPATPASYGSTAPSTSSSFLPESWMPLLDKFKGLALGTAAGVVGEMILNATPDSMKENLSRMIDEATEKLGGTVVRRDGHSAGNGFAK